MVAEIREAHRQTIQRLRDAERRARAEPPPLTARELLLRPVRDCCAWSLVCLLARSPDPVPRQVAAHREIQDELAHRGKSASDIEEMTAMVLWSTAVLNPVNGGTAESGGAVHDLVSDVDDLELAIDVAGDRGATSHELEAKRALLARHSD